MSNKFFACCVVYQLTSRPDKERFTFFGGRVVSASVELENYSVDIGRDIFLPLFAEHPQMEKTRDGIYLAYAQGTYSKDGEEFVFTAAWKDFEFTPLAVRPDLKSKHPYQEKENET